MSPKEFYDAVVEMRTFQQAYKRSKDDKDAEKAKYWEHLVDREVERVELAIIRNPKLRESNNPLKDI